MSITSTMTRTLDRTQIAWALLLYSLSVADYTLTCYLINTSIGIEGNPLLKSLSLSDLGLVKALAVAIVIGVLYSLPKVVSVPIFGKRYTIFSQTRAMHVTNLVYVLVVLWNLGILLVYHLFFS